MHLRSITTAAALAVATALGETAAFAQPASTGDVSPAGVAFLRDQAREANAEMAYGRLSEERGSTPEMNDLGHELVKSAKRDLARLNAVAKGAGIALPATPNSYDEQSLGWLSHLNGTTFDQQLALHVKADAERQLGELQREERADADPVLGFYARDRLRDDYSVISEADNAYVTAQRYNPHGAGQSWYER